MCSTPKSNGQVTRARLLREDSSDYSSWSRTLRRASEAMDRREAKQQRERQDKK